MQSLVSIFFKVTIKNLSFFKTQTGGSWKPSPPTFHVASREPLYIRAELSAPLIDSSTQSLVTGVDTPLLHSGNSIFRGLHWSAWGLSI